MQGDIRTWLYQLQSRAGLTTTEATAVLVMAVIGSAALGVQHWQAQRVTFDVQEVYAARDAAFAAAMESREESSSVERAEALVPEEMSEDEAAGRRGEDVPSRSRASRQAARLAPRSIPINTASAAELERLPGIGPALAGRILLDRDRRGPFRSAEQLMRVRGIGPKTAEAIQPFLRF